MRHKGRIIEFNPEKGGFGIILSNDNQEVNFERCECNYDKIRVGDEVQFHIYKSRSRELEALNIEFLKNKSLSELDRAFNKQIKVPCSVIKSKFKGFILEYYGVEIYLPRLNVLDVNLVLGATTNIYIQSFGYNDYIIATQKENSANVFKEFHKSFENNETLEFEIVTFNSGGILVSNGNHFGFIPNSHIFPKQKEELKEGQKISVKILSCSISTGLKLSIRNACFSETIKTLNEAFVNQKVIKGTVKDKNRFYCSVFFEGLELRLNKDFKLEGKIIDGQEIEFKIIDFNPRKDISISNIEISEFGLLQNFSSNNQFIGLVREIRKDGLIIILNDKYKSCFLPMNEISELLPWNFDYEKIKIGAKVKVSIKHFDYVGVYLSRLLYKKKERRQTASIRYQIGQQFELKIKDKMAKFGVIVGDDNIYGIIHLESILPLAIIPQINKLDFVKHCGNIFKRRTTIHCIINGIDQENNKVAFDLDYSKQENIERVKGIVSYFENDIEQCNIVEKFYEAKVQQQ